MGQEFGGGEGDISLDTRSHSRTNPAPQTAQAGKSLPLLLPKNRLTKCGTIQEFGGGEGDDGKNWKSEGGKNTGSRKCYGRN